MHKKKETKELWTLISFAFCNLKSDKLANPSFFYAQQRNICLNALEQNNTQEILDIMFRIFKDGDYEYF